MGTLTSRQRNRLRSSQFAIPERAPGPGSYPINDPAHARAAVASVHGARTGRPAPPAVQGRVESAVRGKYPKMKLHWHGVHPCEGGRKHAELMGYDERSHEAAYGEAYGLRSGPLGLASGVAGAARHMIFRDGEEGAV